MKYLYLVLAILLPLNAASFELCGEKPEDDTWLRAGLWSVHHGKHATKNQNEVHNQIGIDYGQCTALTYLNSKEQQGYIVARTSVWEVGEVMDVKMKAGSMYGVAYFDSSEFDGKKYGAEFTPAVLGVLQFEIDDFSIDVYIVPSVVTAIGFRWRF